MWYGPVALAGVLLFVANNGLFIWDRLKPTEIFVEATRKPLRLLSIGFGLAKRVVSCSMVVACMIESMNRCRSLALDSVDPISMSTIESKSEFFMTILLFS
jgi:hypothetical protein